MELVATSCVVRARGSFAASISPCVSSPAAQQAVAADAQQLVPIDPWYRSGGGRRAPALAVSAVGRS